MAAGKAQGKPLASPAPAQPPGAQNSPPASCKGPLTLHLLLAKFFWIWRLTEG